MFSKRIMTFDHMYKNNQSQIIQIDWSVQKKSYQTHQNTRTKARNHSQFINLFLHDTL